MKLELVRPGSLTVPLTWYPDLRSLLMSQEAMKPAAPVTHTLPLMLRVSSIFFR